MDSGEMETMSQGVGWSIISGGIAALLAAGCGVASSPGASSSSSATVGIGNATVSGSSEQVLTDQAGHTLYYFGPDTPTTSQCTGSCAGIWPPLLLPSGQPTASGSLPGTLSVVSDANGRQVAYQGHLLYSYSGDSASGQANGNGVNLNGGIWYAATPSLSAAGAAPSPSPSASASSGSSGYGSGY
jgi:predicted lipoprotein with Yx(FWY)xxD motif